VSKSWKKKITVIPTNTQCTNTCTFGGREINNSGRPTRATLLFTAFRLPHCSNQFSVKIHPIWWQNSNCQILLVISVSNYEWSIISLQNTSINICHKMYNILRECPAPKTKWYATHRIQVTLDICAFTIHAFAYLQFYFSIMWSINILHTNNGRNCSADPLHCAHSFTVPPYHSDNRGYKLRPLMVYHWEKPTGTLHIYHFMFLQYTWWFTGIWPLCVMSHLYSSESTSKNASYIQTKEGASKV
jgi:hypothetical protein